MEAAENESAGPGRRPLRAARHRADFPRPRTVAFFCLSFHVPGAANPCFPGLASGPRESGAGGLAQRAQPGRFSPVQSRGPDSQFVSSAGKQCGWHGAPSCLQIDHEAWAIEEKQLPPSQRASFIHSTNIYRAPTRSPQDAM